MQFRTKVALAASKARGKKLGGWRGGPVGDPTAARAARSERAAAYTATVGPIVVSLRSQGLSLPQIAAQVTAQGIRTPRGKTWTPTAVKRLLEREIFNDAVPSRAR